MRLAPHGRDWRPDGWSPASERAPEPSLYKIFEIEYKGIKGTVRQASAKRTLRKIPKSKQE